jgi:hypothetical protein
MKEFDFRHTSGFFPECVDRVETVFCIEADCRGTQPYGTQVSSPTGICLFDLFLVFRTASRTQAPASFQIRESASFLPAAADMAQEDETSKADRILFLNLRHMSNMVILDELEYRTLSHPDQRPWQS